MVWVPWFRFRPFSSALAARKWTVKKIWSNMKIPLRVEEYFIFIRNDGMNFQSAEWGWWRTHTVMWVSESERLANWLAVLHFNSEEASAASSCDGEKKSSDYKWFIQCASPPHFFFLLLLVLPIIEDSCWSELHKLNNDCLAATHARLGEQTSLHALAKKNKIK